MVKILKTILIGLMIFAVFANPFFIECFFSSDKHIESIIITGIIVVMELLLFFISFYLYRHIEWVIFNWKNLFLLSITLLFCLIVLFIVATGGLNKSKVCIDFDKELGWYNQKNCVSTFVAPEYRIPVKTNNYGMRESENFNITTQKYRIALVGDSFVWGTGVEEGERFGEQLQTLLGDNFEVMNFGVIGFGTDQYLLQIKRDVLQFNPPMIIVFFFLNDLENINSTNQYGKNKPRYIVEEGKLKLIGYPFEKIGFKYNFLAFVTFLSNLNELLFPQPHELFLQDIHINLLKKENTLTDIIILNNLLYHEIQTVASENNIRLIGVHIPAVEHFITEEKLKTRFNLSLDQVDFNRTSNMLESLSKLEEFEYIDLYPLLQQNGGLDNYFTQDTHFNEKGNLFVAQVLYDSLQSMNLSNARGTT